MEISGARGEVWRRGSIVQIEFRDGAATAAQRADILVKIDSLGSWAVSLNWRGSCLARMLLFCSYARLDALSDWQNLANATPNNTRIYIMAHFRFPIRQLPVSLQDFASDMETIVDQVFNNGESKGNKCDTADTNNSYRPAIDIVETEQQFDLYMDLPGVKADAVKLEIHEDRLIVSGERAVPAKIEGVTVHRVERLSGKFSRSVQLPKKLDAEKIEAHFDNGELHVVLPKQAKPSPRTIEIKTN